MALFDAGGTTTSGQGAGGGCSQSDETFLSFSLAVARAGHQQGKLPVVALQCK